MERFLFKRKFIADTLATFSAWFLAYFLRIYIPNKEEARILFVLFATLSIAAYIITEILLFTNKTYELKNEGSWVDTIKGLFASSLETFFVLSTIIYFLFSYKISRLTLVFFFPIQFIFLCFGRNAVTRAAKKKAMSGEFTKRVLLVGCGQKLEDAYKEIQKVGIERQKAFIVGQYLGTTPIENLKQIEGNSLEEIVKKENIDCVIISFPSDADSKLVQRGLIDEGMEIVEASIYILPSIPKTYAGVLLESFGNIPSVRLNSSELTQGKKAFKRCFDLFACSFAVVLLSPLFLLISILVKITSPGPIFFKQKRITANGKEFNMLKFRSMRIDMPEQNGPHFTEVDDPRITKIGKLLRKTSLDELPQFFNVLGGSMSLIGPRPERPELVEQFKKEIPGYDIRHKMKAGISGWAQVNGLRGNTSIEKRIDFDLYYINHWSIFFDFKIVLLTFLSGFINKNAY